MGLSLFRIKNKIHGMSQNLNKGIGAMGYRP